MAKTDTKKDQFLTRLMKMSWYPRIFQIGTFLFFTVIFFNLLFSPLDKAANPGMALTWLLWWPLIPLTFFFLGRFWCAICPFGFLGDWVRKFVGLNRPVPNFIKKYGIWIINGLFLLITWYDVTFGLTKSAAATAIVFLLMILAVISFSVLYEGRAWCRHVCFLGGIFGNYSQTAIIEMKGTPDECAKCKDMHCYNGRGDIPGCNLYLTPKTINSNRTCNYCGDCFKSCLNDSPRIQKRTVAGSELWERTKPRLDEAILAVTLVALINMSTLGMLKVWPPIRDLITPFKINATLKSSLWLVLMVAIVILIYAAGAYFSSRIAREDFRLNFIRFGYALIPLNLATHIAHNMNHFLGEGRLIGRAMVVALIPSRAVTDVPVASMGHGSAALVSEPMIQAVQFILVGLGILLSFNVAGRVAVGDGNGERFNISWPHFVVIAIFGFISFWLFSLPMSMRH